jgi:hypothetical protein
MEMSMGLYGKILTGEGLRTNIKACLGPSVNHNYQMERRDIDPGHPPLEVSNYGLEPWHGNRS